MKKTVQLAVNTINQLSYLYNDFNLSRGGAYRQSRKCLMQRWRNLPKEMRAEAFNIATKDGTEPLPETMPLDCKNYATTAKT